jgi:hypothetical protein
MLDHLSYSSISMYLSCPESWRRKYIAQEKTFGTPELQLGSAVHNCIEDMLSTGNFTPGVLWPTAWERALAKGQIFWGADRPEEFFNEGLRLVTARSILSELEKIVIGRDEAGPKIERKIELHVPGVPIPVVGYIDIQTADGVPGDFKTSSKSWTADRAANEMQSLFYLAGLNQAGKTVASWNFRHYIMVKNKEPKWQMFEHKHTPGQLMFLFQMIQRVWRGIEQEVFVLNPTSWKCNPQYCDFWANCRGKN